MKNLHRAALDALGDANRRAIVEMLGRGERSVGQIADGLDISRPAVSRHLRLLDEAGLVEARSKGTRSVYAVRVEGFASVRAFVDEFWDAALARLQALAKR